MLELWLTSAVGRTRESDFLDVVLCFELAVLALVLFNWHPTVQPFPPIIVNSALTAVAPIAAKCKIANSSTRDCGNVRYPAFL